MKKKRNAFWFFISSLFLILIFYYCWQYTISYKTKLEKLEGRIGIPSKTKLIDTDEKYTKYNHDECPAYVKEYLFQTDLSRKELDDYYHKKLLLWKYSHSEVSALDWDRYENPLGSGVWGYQESVIVEYNLWASEYEMKTNKMAIKWSELNKSGKTIYGVYIRAGECDGMG